MPRERLHLARRMWNMQEIRQIQHQKRYVIKTLVKSPTIHHRTAGSRFISELEHQESWILVLTHTDQVWLWASISISLAFVSLYVKRENRWTNNSKNSSGLIPPVLASTLEPTDPAMALLPCFRLLLEPFYAIVQHPLSGKKVTLLQDWPNIFSNFALVLLIYNWHITSY